MGFGPRSHLMPKCEEGCVGSRYSRLLTELGGHGLTMGNLQTAGWEWEVGQRSMEHRAMSKLPKCVAYAVDTLEAAADLKWG